MHLCSFKTSSPIKKDRYFPVLACMVTVFFKAQGLYSLCMASLTNDGNNSLIHLHLILK